MKCKSCGQQAGFCRTECNSCKKERIEKHEREAQELRDRMRRQEELKQKRLSIIKAWVDKFLEYTSDNFLDEEEEKDLNIMKKLDDIKDHEIDSIRTGTSTHFEVYVELREYSKTKNLPQYERSDYPGVNFQKSEAPFLSITAGYFKEKTKTHYEGGSTGVSFRVMRGVWIRKSAFKGFPIKSDYMNFEDVGNIILTNKHLYFKGQTKSFRIRLNKLVDMTPFENGIQIMRDTASARPEFLGIDGDIIQLQGTNTLTTGYEVFCHAAMILNDLL